MGVINVLDKHVAELIAAGEVVERPASVIKELVENAIDAGAKHITVEIKNGGTTFMRVADDGCGIQRDDVRVAFLRHATSKVREQNDLDSIATLGFRGEALASISAVSRLQLITCHKDEEIGTSYVIEGGEEVSLDDAGCPVGTTFIIRDLFFNIPARAKFLKKDISEGISVSNIVDKTALSHPEIAFTYIRDGKQVLRTFGDGKLISAVYAVFGKEFARGLIPVDYSLGGITVQGYVSKPVYSRPNRNMQNFFINGRFVKSRTAMAAIEEAFKGSVMVGKFPSCVLTLSMPYEMIDVNVHPAKLEVRFVNERPVFDAIYHAVKSTLMKNDTTKQASFKNPAAFPETKKFNPFRNAEAILNKPPQAEPVKPQPVKKQDEINPFDELDDITPVATHPEKAPEEVPPESLGLSDYTNPFDIYSKQLIREKKREEERKQSIIDARREEAEARQIAELNTLQETEADAESQPEQPVLFEPPKDDLRFVGELFKTYILVERNRKEMLVIDKHAAHERILYEKLKSEKAGASAQMLLAPVSVTLGKNEYSAAIEHLDMFAACSFEVEDFGNSTVIVRAAPQYIDASEIHDCIAEMAGYLALGKNDIFTEKMEWFYANVACRSAIKAGNTNSPEELMTIVRQLEENKNIRYCPHGRPVSIVMSRNEIENQFGRV